MPAYKQDEAKRIINDRIERSKSFMRPFHDKFLEIYSLYTCYTKNYSQISSGDKANVFIPYVFSKIETKLPRIIQATVNGEDWFKYVGVDNERDDEVAEYHTKLAKFQFNNEIDTMLFFITWWKECFLYGNSFAGVFYEKEIKQIKERTPKYIDKNGINLYPNIIGYDFKMKQKTVYDSISLAPFDIFDCYPAPYGNKVNGLKRDAMDYFIIRSEPSAQYLKAMIENKEIADMHGFDVKAVKKLLDSKPGGTITEDSNRTERMAYRNMTTVNDDDIYNPHYEMWTMWEDDSVVSIIDNEVIRNAGPDKYPFFEMRKPILMALDTPIPHELFALGQIEPILRLQYYAQDLENAKLDSIFDMVYPGWVASIDSFGKDYLPVLRRNMRGLHGCVGNPQFAIAQMQKTDRSLVATNEQVNIERLLNMTLGSADILSGQPSSKQDTATEIMSQIEQSNYRFDLSIRLLKDFSLKELLLMMADRNTQYSPDNKLIRTFGESGEIMREQISASDLIGHLDVIVKTSPVQGNRMVWAQNLLRFLDVINKTGGRYPKLVQEIGKALGIDNTEDYVDDPAQKAVQLIAQAAQEGLLQNPQQAALVLKEVFNVLAPPPQGSAMPGQVPQATNEMDIARQEGQLNAG